MQGVVTKKLNPKETMNLYLIETSRKLETEYFDRCCFMPSQLLHLACSKDIFERNRKFRFPICNLSDHPVYHRIGQLKDK